MSAAEPDRASIGALLHALLTRDPEFCFHPNAATEHRAYPARWVRKRTGRRWRLERQAPGAVFAMTCPNCPAEMYQLDQGMAVYMQMGPTLLLAPEGRGWTA